MKRLMMLLWILLSLSTTVYAEDLTSLVSKDPRFQIVDNKVNVVYQNKEEPIRDVASTIMDTTRNCSGYEFNINIWKGKGNTVILNPSVLDQIIYRTNWTNEFVKNTVPALIPDGMSKEEALLKIFGYISSVYHYDYELRDNGTITDKSDAADAYSLFARDHGVCIAFSCAYRAMIESIPFENGIVNWESANPVYEKVAIVENNQHMWNEIQGQDGEWLIYDAAAGSAYYHKGLPATLAYQLVSSVQITSGEVNDIYGAKWYHY